MHADLMKLSDTFLHNALEGTRIRLLSASSIEEEKRLTEKHDALAAEIRRRKDQKLIFG